MNELSFIANPPIRQEWLDGHPAYEGGDAELVRAYIRLLKSAFRGVVPGSVGATSIAVAAAAGLSEKAVIENWDDLTCGWELRDGGRLFHDGVARLCLSINEQYGAQLDEIRERLAAAELAALAIANGVGVKKAKPGRKAQSKTSIPDDFGLTPDLAQWLSHERGITHPFHHKFLVEGFISYAKSKNALYVDWVAGFKSNVDMIMRSARQLPPPPEDVASRASTPEGVSMASPRRPFSAAPQVERQVALRSAAHEVFGRAQERNAARGGVSAA